jgi:hypothetical protein
MGQETKWEVCQFAKESRDPMSHKCGSVVVFLGLIMNASLYGQERPEVSTLVVTGDSLSAGYQNAQLIESGQVHGYANVIATQAGVWLNLPLLPPPGYPQITIEQNYAVATGLTPVARRNTRQTLDVAVPGFSVAELVGLQPSCDPDPTNPIEVMAAEILNPNCSTNPGPSELEEAAALKPKTAILWIGSNDVLFSLLYGTPPTDVSTFNAFYHLAAATMAGASERLVLANVPDVTLVPYPHVGEDIGNDRQFARARGGIRIRPAAGRHGYSVCIADYPGYGNLAYGSPGFRFAGPGRDSRSHTLADSRHRYRLQRRHRARGGGQRCHPGGHLFAGK